MKASSSLSKTASKTTKQADASAIILNTSHHHPRGPLDQSSPDRSGLGSANLLSKLANPNLDWIMKQNKLKINTRLEEERRQRQASEERQRKKREQLELNNQMVRCANKEKTYKQQQQRGPLGEQQAA